MKRFKWPAIIILFYLVILAMPKHGAEPSFMDQIPVKGLMAPRNTFQHFAKPMKTTAAKKPVTPVMP
jgi:hypothetical protein